MHLEIENYCKTHTKYLFAKFGFDTTENEPARNLQTSNVISDSFLKSTKLDRAKVREGPPLRGGVPAVPRRAPPPHHRAGAHARALPLLAPSAAARAASTSLFSK